MNKFDKGLKVHHFLRGSLLKFLLVFQLLANMDVDLYDDLLISDEPSEREKALADENESLKV